MTTRKANVQGGKKPALICSLCGDELVANPEGRGWRAYLHADEAEIYDHRPAIEGGLIPTEE